MDDLESEKLLETAERIMLNNDMDGSMDGEVCEDEHCDCGEEDCDC